MGTQTSAHIDSTSISHEHLNASMVSWMTRHPRPPLVCWN